MNWCEFMKRKKSLTQGMVETFIKGELHRLLITNLRLGKEGKLEIYSNLIARRPLLANATTRTTPPSQEGEFLLLPHIPNNEPELVIDTTRFKPTPAEHQRIRVAAANESQYYMFFPRNDPLIKTLPLNS